MVFKYCPDCGLKLNMKQIGDEGDVPFCTSCKRPFFSFSYPCVLCLVINEDNEIALIKQSYVSSNYVGIAGYVKQGENIEETAKREVEEELGLEVINVEYIKSFYYERRDNLMFGFVCKVKKAEFNISKEVDDAGWFSLENAVDVMTPGSIVQNLLKYYLRTIKNL